MKRLLFIILISLSVVSARADERSQSVLRRVAEYVKTLGEYDARFWRIPHNRSILCGW